MTTQQMNSQRVNWRRAEFVLTGVAVLGFVTLLIRVKMLWAGLPAHPMFIHVPVILIPATIAGVLICLARPATFERYGILLCLVSIIAMSSVFLAMQAGGALSGALHLAPYARHLINEHSHAADILAIAFTLLTAALILTFSAYRIGGGMPTGVKLIDDLLGSQAIALLLRVVLLILAIVCAYYVFRVGDLGAKAVWAGRLQH